MGRVAVPSMGPYEKWVHKFIEISDKAFCLLEDIKCPEASKFESLARKTFLDLSVIAETTSICVRFAVSHSFQVPAFALARVRLEQCIKSSFLIHAPQKEGMGPYLEHGRVAMADVLRKHESSQTARGKRGVGFKRKELPKQVLNPCGGSEGSKSWWNWTRLDLRELAVRRDELAKGSSVLPWKLQDEYSRLSPLTSLFVHGACETTLELGTFHEPEVGSGKRYPYMLPGRARWIMSAVARFDLVQAYETLARLKGPEPEVIRPLIGAYKREVERSV